MIISAKWVLPIEGAAVADGAVRVEGDRISAVGPVSELKKSFPNDEFKDFGRSVILPGLVDLHTHLETTVFRGLCDDLDYADWKIQLALTSKALSFEEWRTSAELGAVEAVRSGITCIGDITARGASFMAAAKAGLRGTIYYEISCMGNCDTKAITAGFDRETERWQKDANGDGRLKIGLGPHSPYATTPVLFQAISRKAQKDDLPVAFHLAGSSDEYDFVKYGSSKLATVYQKISGWEEGVWQPTGVSPVKYLQKWDAFEGRVLAVHCVHVNEADVDILSKHDVAIAYCPKCNAKLGMGIAPLPLFLSRDLRVGIGTDTPASNNTMDLFDEMRVGLLLQRGLSQNVGYLSAERFVEMATIGGAEALDLSAEIGTLTPGKQADIIVVDVSQSHQIPGFDPYSALVYAANQEDVLLTMVAGRTLYEKGSFMTLEAEEILEASEPVRQKLIQAKVDVELT